MKTESKFPSFDCELAILDVTRGRRALAKHFEGRPIKGPCPEELRIPIMLMGYIDDRYSVDDGNSTEFKVVVEELFVTTAAEMGPERTFGDFLQKLEHAPLVFILSDTLGDYVKIDKAEIIERVNTMFEQSKEHEFMRAFSVDELGNLYIE